jgi:hypothetical protein
MRLKYHAASHDSLICISLRSPLFRSKFLLKGGAEWWCYISWPSRLDAEADANQSEGGRNAHNQPDPPRPSLLVPGVTVSHQIF